MTNGEKQWHLHNKGNDVESIKTSILSNLEYRLAKDKYGATTYDRFLATAYAVQERVLERWINTQQKYHHANPKRVYYISMEFLLGRSLSNSLINLGLYDEFKSAVTALGMDFNEIIESEFDAGLGNGGLGRLAACFLDSMATMGIPAVGYGIRYNYGLFNQKIMDGRQMEEPDNWLKMPNPWEIERPEFTFKVQLNGTVSRPLHHENDPKMPSLWDTKEIVEAVAFDMPTPGFNKQNVNTLRLWTAQSAAEFNLDNFNQGDYMSASYNQVMSENISKILYPNDHFFVGRELRLKQEYFLVSASIRDIIRRFKSDNMTAWITFPEHVAIQLNDTHPSLAIPELMRLLVDEEGLTWDIAWDITKRTFSYTNHTVLPEALEEWPTDMMEKLLPRHMEIIYLINYYFLQEVSRKYPGDVERLRRMSIISEEGVKRVRMAYLACVGCHKVNGVAELHTRLLKETVLKDFADFWPDKFINITNGVTPRRWILKANKCLSGLIKETIGTGWITDLFELHKLEDYADDPAFHEVWRIARQHCSAPLIKRLFKDNNIIVPQNSILDVQVKRIHEYKRQLLFALFIVARYLDIKDNPNGNFVPRTCIVGGKAAPGYWMAKNIILFVNRIADMINHDPQVEGKLQIAFMPNYGVSLAEDLIPAATLSEQISTAGKEASGTGNMKLALNGAVTIGTMDGANIEILEEVGRDNMFIFGLNANQVSELKSNGYDPATYIGKSEKLQRVLRLIECDFFSPGDSNLFRPIYEHVTRYDEYLIAADFESYLKTQAQVDEAYRDQFKWTKMSILNCARCGKFSSDRSIAEYATKIWDAETLFIAESDTVGLSAD
ncbi:MAG: glycogen/starch/alpha-glucan phosphorylase [bacterium]